MSAASPALCLLVLAAVLPAGQTRTIGPDSPPLQISSLSKAEKMCAGCTKIVKLFQDMLSKADRQELIRMSINQLCASDECVTSVKKYLPAAVKGFLSFAMHKEGEICMALGMCAFQPEREAPEALSFSMEATNVIQERPSTGTSYEVQISPQCTFCLLLIKKLEEMLPTERTEEMIVAAMEKICNHLPDQYKEECNNFLETYGKQIIDFLLKSATPHTICTLLHLCLVQETPAVVPSMPSDCQSCRTLVILTQVHLGQNATGLQTNAALHKTCLLHPNALPGCEKFIESHGLTLVRILSKKEEAVHACQTFFCMGHE